MGKLVLPVMTLYLGVLTSLLLDTYNQLLPLEIHLEAINKHKDHSAGFEGIILSVNFPVKLFC